MERKHMKLWYVPQDILDAIPNLPKRIYCNKDLIVPLEQAFRNLIKYGCADELKTWDGCFNIRKKRGGNSWSLHAWAIAIDLNAATNGFRKKPTLSEEFVCCFESAGFDWGGYWTTNTDGMHFQLKTI